MNDGKALAKQIYEAKTAAEIKAANERLEKHVRDRVRLGMKAVQVRAAIKAWITRLKKWERG